MLVAVAVGLGLLTVSVMTAGPANAMPGLTRVAAQSPTDRAATKTVAAYCPPGTVALGGGGFTTPARAYDVKIRALGVHLTDTGSYYAITADVASDPTTVPPWGLSVTATCAPQPAGYEIRTSYSAFTAGTFKGLSASCSPGKKALSAGGFVYTTGGGAAPQLTLNGVAFVQDNAASMGAQTWRYGFAGNWMDELDLVCANPLPGYTKVTNTVQVAGNPADHAAHGVSSGACPPGTSSIGLGAVVGTVGQRVQPLWVNIYPNSVYVQGAADTEGEANTWSMTAQVICAS